LEGAPGLDPLSFFFAASNSDPITISDMTALSYLHEPGILHNLRLRYAKDEIYTYTGAILIALNPWRPVPHIYSQEVVRKYADCPHEDHDKLPPHVYMIAKTSYLTMRETKSNQVTFSFSFSFFTTPFSC